MVVNDELAKYTNNQHIIDNQAKQAGVPGRRVWSFYICIVYNMSPRKIPVPTVEVLSGIFTVKRLAALEWQSTTANTFTPNTPTYFTT